MSWSANVHGTPGWGLIRVGRVNICYALPRPPWRFRTGRRKR